MYLLPSTDFFLRAEDHDRVIAFASRPIRGQTRASVYSLTDDGSRLRTLGRSIEYGPRYIEERVVFSVLFNIA